MSRRGLRQALIGSVSGVVVHHAHCPVVVVRDEDQGAQQAPARPFIVNGRAASLRRGAPGMEVTVGDRGPRWQGRDPFENRQA